MNSSKNCKKSSKTKTASILRLFLYTYSRERIAKLSPRAVKKADKIIISLQENSFDIAIAKELAKATISQFEKSEIHIIKPLIYFMRGFAV